MTTKKASQRPKGYAGPGYKARTAAFSPLQILDIADVTYMTTGQVARVFGVTPRTAAGWYDRGLLKGIVVPGTTDRRFFRESVRNLAVELGVVPASPAAVAKSVATIGLTPPEVAALAGALRVPVLDTPACSPILFALRLPADPLACVVSTAVGRPVAQEIVTALAGHTRRTIAVVTAADDYTSYEFRKLGASILLRSPLDARQAELLAAALTRTPSAAGAK